MGWVKQPELNEARYLAMDAKTAKTDRVAMLHRDINDGPPLPPAEQRYEWSIGELNIIGVRLREAGYTIDVLLDEIDRLNGENEHFREALLGTSDWCVVKEWDKRHNPERWRGNDREAANE